MNEYMATMNVTTPNGTVCESTAKFEAESYEDAYSKVSEMKKTCFSRKCSVSLTNLSAAGNEPGGRRPIGFHS